MVDVLKRFIYRLLAGANCAVVILMWVCALSYYINPAAYPALACLGLLFPFFLLANLLFALFWLIFHVRYLLITLIGSLCCAGAINRYVPVNWPAKAPADCVKVLSFNILNYYEAEEDATFVNSIVRYLIESEADIICLQEGKADKTETQKRIDALLKKSYPYQGQTLLKKGKNLDRRCYSKYPILSAEVIAGTGGGTNGATAYEIVIENDTVLLVNNHLKSNSLTLDERAGYKDLTTSPSQSSIKWGLRTMVKKVGANAAIRAAQCDSVLNYIGRSPHESVIVCGDFNDSPLSYAHRKLSKDLSDSFVESGNGLGHSFDEQGIHVRIDYILHSADWKSYRSYVDSDIKDSDHYPVITHLKRR